MQDEFGDDEHVETPEGKEDRELDDALEDSFPASDPIPPSHEQPPLSGPKKESDRKVERDGVKRE